MTEYIGEERREHQRRQHDEECEKRFLALKGWVSDKICLATKGSKIWARFMWALVMLMLTLTLGGNLYGISVASDQKSIDTQQTADIKHNTEVLAEMKTANREILATQAQVQKDISAMAKDMTRMITILEEMRK